MCYAIIHLSDIISNNTLNGYVLQSHWLTFWIEYGLSPWAVFTFVCFVVRKEQQDYNYAGISRWIKVLGRNWLELTCILGASWLLFEYRLIGEGIPLDISLSVNSDIVSTTRAGSVISFLGMLILFLIYAIYVIKSINASKLHPAVIQMVKSVKFAAIPFVFNCNLWLTILFYSNDTLRIMVLLVCMAAAIGYFNTVCYSSYYWFALAGTMNRLDENDQLKALQYRLKSYKKLHFNKKDAKFKYARILECCASCMEINHTFKINVRENRKFVKMLRQTRDAVNHGIKETLKTPADNLNFNKPDLDSCLEQLVRIMNQ